MTALDAWLVALAAPGTLGPALLWLAYEMTRPGPLLPSYGRTVVPMDAQTVPVGRASVPTSPTPVPTVRVADPGADPYAWFAPPEAVYAGRHRPEVLEHGWPAAEVRQLTAATGEWAVVDLTGAQWGERYELEPIGGVR